MAQSAVRLLPNPDFRGSNPVIGSIIYYQMYKTPRMNKNETENGHFFKINFQQKKLDGFVEEWWRHVIVQEEKKTIFCVAAKQCDPFGHFYVILGHFLWPKYYNKILFEFILSTI